jgi:hypothetical protein
VGSGQCLFQIESKQSESEVVVVVACTASDATAGGQAEDMMQAPVATYNSQFARAVRLLLVYLSGGSIELQDVTF